MLIAVLAYTVSTAQIFPGFFNDFQDGTTQGWSNGGSSPNPPTNVADGGPGGAGDAYLEEISSGTVGPGSRMVVFNTSSDWQGDYSSLIEIAFNARNTSDEDLFIRLAFEGGSDDTSISSTNSVTVPAQSDWAFYSLNVEPAEFTIIGGANSVTEVLADVNEIRILHSDTPSFIGAIVAATLHLDNISTSGLIGFEDKLKTTFQAVPNPAVNSLQLTAQVDMESYVIYNLLGAKVAQGIIEGTQKQIDVSALQSGAYIIEISAGNQSVTQKFLKQ